MTFRERLSVWAPYSWPIHTITLVALMLYFFYDVHDSHLIFGMTKDRHVGYVFTSIIVHISAWHLWNNLALIFLFGTLFEAVHGSLNTVLIFWICGSFGALSEWFVLDANTTFCGSSPAAFALIGAHASHILVNYNEAPFKRAAILIVGGCIITSIVSSFISPSTTVTIAHFSHLGGFLHGFTLGVSTVRNLKVAEWEVALRCLFGVLSIASYVTFFGVHFTETTLQKIR